MTSPPEAPEAPRAREGQTVLSGPERVRGEHWWSVRLADGTRCVLAQLLPELAADESLRRRYVRDSERRAALDAPGVAPVLAVGPAPDPRDPAAEPPWRLRVEPAGERLSEWLARRAPAPVDEALELVARLADLLHGVHARGAVLRDLEPRNVVLDDDGRPWLTDIGLARVDILSTRSASSLMLESSPYAAPEHLRATVIDHRADLYTLGAILWQGLTGTVPFADGPALLGERGPLPRLADMGAVVPDDIEALATACLAQDRDDRPESAREVAACLRGVPYRGAAVAARVACQACGAPMRPGLRLCLACGKEAVQFRHVGADNTADCYRITLVKASESAEFVAKLRAFFETVGEGPVPELNFIIGDARMYSKAERARLHQLPVTLLTDLSRGTAERLAAMLKEQGFRVKIRRVPAQAGRKAARRWLIVGGVGTVTGTVLVAGGSGVAALALAPLAFAAGAAGLVIGGLRAARRKKPRPPALASLRAAPAALPASDPLVARLGALLADDLAADVRERVEHIALLVQRLVDHRARHADATGEVAMLIEPLEPLIDHVSREVKALSRCDRALAELDEGALVRAIATSEARREPRTVRVELMAGLDRLRELEDDRAGRMQRLLEATSLIRRAVELGLSRREDAVESNRCVTMALAALGES